MTYAGAQGETATQMAKALHGPSSPQTLFAGQDALSLALAGRAAAALSGDRQIAQAEGEPAPSPSDYQLQVVNSVWGQKGLQWATPFLDVLAADYGTGVHQLDFATQPEQARTTINTWVSNETSDKINDLLPMGSIDMNTQMVLVNAIHLKLPWASAAIFPASLTEDADFTTGAGKTVSTPFMNQTSTFPYVDDADAQSVALPSPAASSRSSSPSPTATSRLTRRASPPTPTPSPSPRATPAFSSRSPGSASPPPPSR